MAIKTNSAEGGTNGTGVTSGNSGGGSGDAFSFLTIGGGTVTFDNTRAAHGTLSYKITPTSGQAANANYSGLNTTDFAMRYYIYLTAASTDDTYFMRHSNSGGGTRLVSLHTDSAGKLVLRSPTTTLWTSTAAIPLNTWVRIELYCHIAGGTSGKVKAAYYPGDSTTATDSYSNLALDMGTTAIDQAGFFKYNTQLYATAFWADDIKVDTAATDLIGPVGANTPPAVTPPAPQRLVSGSAATLTMTATDSDGTIASRAWAVTSYPAGASAPTLTNATTATATTSTLTVPGIYTFTPSATDNSAATTSGAAAVVYVYAADGSAKVRQKRGGSTWTNGSVSDLNDASDSTYGESVAAPVLAAVTYDMDPIIDGTVSPTVRSELAPLGGAACTLKVEVLTTASDTVVLTRTINLTDAWVSTTITPTGGETSAFTDHSVWAIRLTANQT